MRRGQKLWITATIWLVIIGFALGGIIFFTPGGPQSLFTGTSSQDEEAAAVVNGEKISQSELEFAYQSTIQRYRQLYQQIGGNFDEQLQGASGAYYRQELRGQAAEGLIRKALLQQEARERDISVSQTELDRAFRERYDQFLQANGVTEEKLLEFLRDPSVRERFRRFFGLERGTLSEFKGKLRSEVAWELRRRKLRAEVVGKIEPTLGDLLGYVEENRDRYLSRIVGAVAPTGEELRGYFEAHRERYGGGEEAPTFEEVRDQVEQDYVEEKQEERFQGWLASARERGAFPRLEEIRARHILIEVPQDASPEQVQSAARRIAELRGRLEEGDDFAQLAEQYSQDTATASQGGDLGWFGHGEMAPPFEAAAYALEVGEISQPIRTQFGYHLIQLEERRMSDELEQEVRQAYVQGQEDQKFEAWAQSIEDGAEVEVKDPLLAAYRAEERANQVEDPEEKLSLLDRAIAAYQEAQRELVGDPYLGYYESLLYQRKIEVLQGQMAALGEEAPAEERERLQQRIERSRRSAVESFLRSAGSYTQGDEAEFEKIVKAAPEDAELRYGYARFLIDKLGDEARATRQLERALELDPDYWQAHLLAADVMMRASAFGEAIAHLKGAEAGVEPGSQEQQEVRIRLAEAYLARARQAGRTEEERAADLAEAEGILTRQRGELAGSDRRQAEPLALLGDVYMEQGSFAEAQEAYDASLAASGRLEVEVKLGRAYLAGGQNEKALETFQSALARQAGQYSAEAHLGLGDAHRAMGEVEAALEAYQKVLDLRTDTANKVEAAQKIVELDPGDVDTRFKLAALYEEARRLSEAARQYERILELVPDSWRAEEGLGRAYLGLSEYERAQAHLKAALGREPPTERKIAIYQAILEAERGLAGPEGKLEAAGQEALFRLAELYLKQGREERARERIETLEAEYPDFRPGEVAELKRRLEGTAEGGEDGKPGRSVVIQPAQHVSPGESHPPYNSKPPTSGWHYTSEAGWGVHEQPIPDELQVHNLEHGGVLIQYRPEEADTELVNRLTALAERLRERSQYCKLILAPYSDMAAPLALTAWGRILELEGFDEQRMIGFIDAFIDRGPEKTPCP